MGSLVFKNEINYRYIKLPFQGAQANKHTNIRTGFDFGISYQIKQEYYKIATNFLFENKGDVCKKVNTKEKQKGLLFYEVSITGIISIRISSFSSLLSSGLMIPARLGADISRVMFSQARVLSISCINFELKPISMSSPS